MDIVNGMLNGEEISGFKYKYISGDFTESLELAREYEGTNYGGYHLLINNCKHYIQELLSVGDFDDTFVKSAAIGSVAMSPIGYYYKFMAANTTEKISRGEIKIVLGPLWLGWGR